MLYLFALPIIIVAVIVKLVSDKFGLKLLSFISKIVIILGVIFFIYFFADYYGYNIIDLLFKLK